VVLTHYDLKIELPDSWWAEAGMAGFVPNGRAFRPASQGEGDVEVFEAAIEAFIIIIPGILPNVKGKILSLSKSRSSVTSVCLCLWQ
jgi:hypothetical protein